MTQIANKIRDSKSELVLKYTTENAAWKQFLEGELKDTNDRNAIHLGGRDPRARHEEDEMQQEDVKLELPGIMQKFTRFFGVSKNRQPPKKDDDEEEVNEEEE